MKDILKSILLNREFDEEICLISFAVNNLNKDILTVYQSGWCESGKYSFESDLVIKVDNKHFRLKLKMFGNNPRDDFQCIEVIDVTEVEYKQKVVYSWEEV